MKKVLAIAFLMAVLGANTAFADVLPPGQKAVQVCAYFNNTESMLNTLGVFGYETDPAGAKVDLSEFIGNECFSPSYKFNHYFVYGVTAKHAAAVNVDTYNPSTDPESFTTNIQPEMGVLYVPANSTLTKAMNEYRIVKLDTAAGHLIIEPVLTKKFYGTSDTPTIVEGTVTSMTGVDNPPVTGDKVFSDVDANNPYYGALLYLKNNSIVSGYPDGSFKPDKTINRAEFMKIVSGNMATADELTNCAAHYTSQSDYMVKLFTDVTFAMVGGNQPDWFFDYVCYGKLNNIIAGYPDGSFRPANEINFVEAAKIIVTSSGQTTGTSTPWYKIYVDALGAKSAIPTSIKNFDQKITRGEMAEMMYRLRAKITNLSSQSYSDLK